MYIISTNEVYTKKPILQFSIVEASSIDNDLSESEYIQSYVPQSEVGEYYKIFFIARQLKTDKNNMIFFFH